MPAKIDTLDFCYENSQTTIVANRNFAELKLAGLNVGPFDEGNEYQVYYWIAKALEASGIVHLREDDILDAGKLYKVQWKEGVQIPGMISELPEEFYPKLRRYLSFAEEEAKQPDKIQEYHKAKALATRHHQFTLEKNCCFILGFCSIRPSPKEADKRRKNYLRPTRQNNQHLEKPNPRAPRKITGLISHG